MLRTWCRKFNFSIIPVDDFKIVIGMEFLDHVHTFLALATNFLSIIIGSKVCMVPTERAKSIEKTLSAMQFKKVFKKNLSFSASIQELNEGEDCGNLPNQFLLFVQEVLDKFKDVILPKLSKKLPLRQEVNYEIELE